MSLLTAQQLSKSYGAQDVFRAVTLAIPHQARIGLVGSNGSGKSTLLRILAGLERPDVGKVHRARRLRVGYLPQEVMQAEGPSASLEGTLWAFCLEALEDLRSREAELSALEAAMADPRRAEDALARYGPMQEAFERDGGYVYSARVQRVLSGLGFSREDEHRPLRQFSGGERTRAYLARLILEDPALLLLDEPTNHLDIQALEWLEGWMRDWPGALVAVSHDRYFLDRVADQVWELAASTLTAYRGNYSAYVSQRADRRAAQTRAHTAQQEHIRSEQAYIQRNIAGQNTRQAKGRRRRLERLQRQALEAPAAESAIHFSFRGASRSGDLVLETHGLQVGYSDAEHHLFAVPDLQLRRGTCAAIIGPNGAGKTTFMRMLIGDLPPLTGQVRIGAGVELGYFAQAHADLDMQQTVLQSVRQVQDDLTDLEARDLLARFLLRGDDVEKDVASLSGGERGRLALARLMLQGANLLLLDEPTAHLDVRSQETLQEALRQFAGTILLVSHDRYLINGLAGQIWRISPDERRMEVFPGNYDAMLEAERERLRPDAVPEDTSRRSAPRRAGRSYRQQAALEQLEARIDHLEGALRETSAALEAAGPELDRVRQLGEIYARLDADLASALAEWEALQHESADTRVI
jgi:ATP-binding cassette subfamily F protein 3